MDSKRQSVADVMTTDPVFLDSGATLEVADIVLRSTFIKGIPVVDGQGRLVGTISHAHLAAHRFAEVDRTRAETDPAPAEQTEGTD
jgi:CBS-domain-containing membrane protein